MEPRIPKLEEIYDRIDAERGAKMSLADGYQWGLEYIQDVIMEIEKLEKRALSKNDPAFYNSLRMSAQRAQEVRHELQSKLGVLRNPN